MESAAAAAWGQRMQRMREAEPFQLPGRPLPLALAVAPDDFRRLCVMESQIALQLLREAGLPLPHGRSAHDGP